MRGDVCSWGMQDYLDEHVGKGYARTFVALLEQHFILVSTRDRQLLS